MKFLVLAVLKDGSFQNAREIARALEVDFGLKCRANTVRKDLERYLDQDLVRREKMSSSRRCWHYNITKKGLGRYEYFRARQQNTLSTEVGSPSDGNAERKSGEDSLLNRTVRAVATIRICDATLKLAGDRSLRELASYLAVQSTAEYVEMLPRMPEKLFITSLYWLCQSFNHQPIQRDSDNEFIWMYLVSRKNDEPAYLLNALQEAEDSRDRYSVLYEEAESRNRSQGSRIETREAEVDAACWKGFKLGVACGRLQATLDWMAAQLVAFLSLLQRRSEKEQLEREYFHAILSRRSMNERWWDMLPTTPDGPSRAQQLHPPTFYSLPPISRH